MRARSQLLICLIMLLSFTPLFAGWELYEETNVKGSISGTIKKGRVIQMQSGSIYEVTDLTLQLVLELAPEAIILKDGAQFKLSIKGFNEPLICRQLVPPAVGISAAESSNKGTSAAGDVSSKDIPLDTLMPPTQQGLMGINKLTPEERERLRLYLISLYLQSVEQGRGNKPASASITDTRATASAIESQISGDVNGAAKLKDAGDKLADAIAKVFPAGDGPDLIESKIDGNFEGWVGETIFKLANGQIWQQVSYAYTYHYAFSPNVMIVKVRGTYKMKVDGVDFMIFVKRLK